MIQQQVEEIKKAGVVEDSSSPWASPIVLDRKSDNTWRFCVDYRKLNAVTVKDAYPLPHVDSSLSRLEGAKFFSTMDMQSGFWQIPMH